MFKIFLNLFFLSFTTIHGFSVQPRIINGILSKPSDFPFFVHISFEDSQCSATLLSDRWILTAAHCLKDKRMFMVGLGIDENGRFSREYVISTTNQYMHPMYSSGHMQPYDIGLIELPSKVLPNQYIQPIQLPTECGDNLENIDVIAIGSGKSNLFGRNQDSLMRHGYFATMLSDNCTKRLINNYKNPASVLCAEPNMSQSIYRGDSGGPLLRRSNGSLVGIASFVYGSNNPPEITLQVFTKIHTYYDWISEMTGLDLPVCPSMAKQ